MADDVSLGDAASSALQVVTQLAGYGGSLCLFIGGLSTFFSIPLIGQITYLNGPTGSGFLYLLVAGLSVYITYTSRFFLLYLSGGLAAVMMGFDILNGTRIGYVMQMALGGGLSASMGGGSGSQDPIVSGMMQNAGFTIPTAWMILAGGIFILLITPSLAQKKQDEKPGNQPVKTTRDQILENRMRELDNLILIYERGHISKEEFDNLKKEIMARERLK
ncbi:MAG: hypothetical protein LUQ50_14245 [Methanospirillum sp.]|uniref:hypothetical protein n=1 Tax=Methanospirillum sp. TaxID=45200 RepID=UPI0023753472|nr:hypothetical protein [Methanospirillum sp.]MDD1730215.1 hypothetical protein [Methanospirillum sp.]